MNPDLEKRVPREILEELIEGRNRSLSRDPGEVVQRGHASGEKRVFGSGGLREGRRADEGIGTDSKASGFRLEWESCAWRFPRCEG